MSTTGSLQLNSQDSAYLGSALNKVDELATQQNLSNYSPGSALGQEVQDVIAVAYRGQQRYFSPDSGMNAQGNQFLEALAYQMSQQQTQLNSGNGNLAAIKNLAELGAQALGYGPSAQGTGTTGTGTTGTGTTGTGTTGTGTTGTGTGVSGTGTGMSGAGGTGGFAQVQSDLASEAQAKTVAGKAGYVQQAIGDLIGALGGGATAGGGAGVTPVAGGAAGGAGPGDTTAGDATAGNATAGDATGGTGAGGPTDATGGAGATGSIDPQTANQLLNVLDQLSQVAQHSGAPASVQDSIAALVGQISSMLQNGASRTGVASGAPTGDTGGGTDPTSGSADGTGGSGDGTSATGGPGDTGGTGDAGGAGGGGQPVASGGGQSFVPLLQELAQILQQLEPLLQGSKNGGKTLDSLAKVIGQLAQELAPAQRSPTQLKAA